MLTHVSLFSGIGGFELAMAEAGIPTLAACEIDKKARGVLADRFPGTHIYHDVRKVTGDGLRTLGAVPRRTVLSAGWPCQGNSVAGSRGGMDDARSGLWSEVVRILAEFRPAWFVGENVPGLLSVNGGADFATVVGDLAELGYGLAWRVLDAQHFGVPQRRRRVVIVGRLGDSGRAPAQVLLEPEGGGRNPAEGITPRPIFTRRTHAGTAGGFVPRIAKTLCANSSQSLDSDLEDFVVGALGRHAHTLTAEGHDASEDGTGRGTPIVVAPRLAATLTAGQAKPGISAPGRRQEDDHSIVAFQCHGSNVGPMGTIRKGDGGLTSGVPFISYVADIANALDTAQGGPDDNSAQAGHLVAVIAPTLRATNGSGGMAGNVGDLVLAGLAAGSTVVRRLTPLETCRLQGYPDGHTATSDGKPQADSAQYKQHGNGIAVPVFSWVCRRIAAVDRAQDRFWSKVSVDCEGCWEWMGAIADGYGAFRDDFGKRVRAHRYSYESELGPIPAGMELDHLCRNKSCVRPDHLEPVTHQVNAKRHYSLTTECPRGHAYDDSNTYINHGRRHCRACNREKQRERRGAQ